MPKLEANDVPHTSQTDHRVIRHRGSSDPGPVLEALTVYQADRLPADLVDRARGLSYIREAEADVDRLLADRAIGLLAPWVGRNPSDAEAISALGTAYTLTRDTRMALTALTRALEIDPASEYTLRQLMYLSHDMGDADSGIQYGRRLIQVNPHHAEYHGRLAHMLGQKRQWSSAIDSALEAVQLRPWDARIHGWLAEAYQAVGQTDLARRHQQLHLDLRPPQNGAER
jgi:tetratricopeptide (TPR) repeat protein